MKLIELLKLQTKLNMSDKLIKLLLSFSALASYLVGIFFLLLYLDNGKNINALYILLSYCAAKLFTWSRKQYDHV